VHTLFGHQMGGRKSYNPKNKGKKSYQPILTFLSERGTVPGGNVSGVRNRRHLTRLSELKWIRQAKAVESLAFHTRI
jgi:hypothetical protein